MRTKQKVQRIPVTVHPELVEVGARALMREAVAKGWLAFWQAHDLPRKDMARAVLAGCFQEQVIVSVKRMEELQEQLQEARDRNAYLARRLRDMGGNEGGK